MRRSILLYAMSFCMFATSFETDGQHIRRYSEESDELSYEEYLDLAETLYELELYFPAKGYYETAKSIASIDLIYDYHLAECYRKLRYYRDAAELYRQVWEKDPEGFPEAQLFEGTMNLADGNLQAAEEILKKYQQKIGNSSTSNPFVNLQLANVAFAKEGIKRQNKIEIEGLNNEINQSQTTFAAHQQDDRLYYASAVAVTRPLRQNYSGFKGKFDTVYVNRLWQCMQINGQWTNREQLDIVAESKFSSIGSPYWVDSQKRLYYTVCSNVEADKPCKIFYSELKDDGSWSQGVALGNNINQANSSTKHAMVLEYSEGLAIFFSSNRLAGGYGGFDLWYAKMDKTGNIGAPINLGPTINTPYDEVTPFLHKNSRNLFFSSNGHKGFGELDVFMIRLDLQLQTGKLYHLDYPINSTADDYYFTLGNDGHNGFLSSNRVSDLFASYLSYADKIYKIQFEPDFGFIQLPHYLTEMETFSASEAGLQLFDEEFAFHYLDAGEATLARLQEEAVDFSGQLLMGDSAISGRKVMLENEKGEIIGEAISDENGLFEFKSLPSDGSYMLVLDEDDEDMTILLDYKDLDGNTLSHLASTESNHFYKFKQLEDDATDNGLLTLSNQSDISFTGQLLHGDSSMANRTVILENERGELVGQTTSDENGNFEFRSLPSTGSFVLVLSDEDPGMTVLLDYKDQDGNTLSSLRSDESNRFYTFKNLDNYLINTSALALMNESDVRFSGQLCLGDSSMANRTIFLENERGEVVSQTTSDENGNFEFKNLPPDGSYVLVLSEEDADMNILLTYKDEDGNIVSSLNSDETKHFYKFKNLDNYLADANALALMEESDVNFSGKLQLGDSSMANRTVILENEKGEVVGQTTSDENGNFEFRNLPSDGSYVLVLSEEDADMNILLDYKDQDGNTVSTLNSDETGQFYKFQNLDNYLSDTKSLAQMDESDVIFSGKLLLGDSSVADRTVILENEKGEVVGRTTSDENGNFEFRNLPSDGSYVLVLSENDADMNILLDYKDQDGNTLSSLKSDETGQFYKFMNLDNYMSDAKALALMEESDVNFSGKLLMGDSSMANRTVFLENEQGEVVGQTTSDENGNFEFKNLPSDGSYVLVLSEEDANMNILLDYQDEDGNTLSSLNSNEGDNFYKFKNLDNYLSDANKLDLMNESDVNFSGLLCLGDSSVANRTVLLENENGEVVGQTTSDENGHFEFKNLPADGNYVLVLGEEDSGMNILLDYQDQDGNTLASLNSNEADNFYKFKNLDNYMSDAGELTPLEAADINFSGKLVLGDSSLANRTIILENEDGEVIGQTTSDENGQFEFKNLPADGNYILVLSEEDANMNILLDYQDQDGNTLSSLNSNETDDFYRFKNLDNYLTDDDKINEPASDADVGFKMYMTPTAYKNLQSKFTEEVFENVFVRVQIGAYRYPKPGIFDHMTGIPKIEEDYVDDLTKFLVGRFKRIEEAEPLRVSVCDQGIPDAFIAIYYKGKRVSAIYY